MAIVPKNLMSAPTLGASPCEITTLALVMPTMLAASVNAKLNLAVPSSRSPRISAGPVRGPASARWCRSTTAPTVR